jgi:hypothetical protein
MSGRVRFGVALVMTSAVALPAGDWASSQAQTPQAGAPPATRGRVLRLPDPPYRYTDIALPAHFTTAAANFKRLTQANPKDAQAWHMLGYSLHAAGKLDEALPVHLKATEFPETAPAATYNVACVHALKGQTDQAFLWLEKAVAAGFDDAEQLRRDEDFASQLYHHRLMPPAGGGGSRVRAGRAARQRRA